MGKEVACPFPFIAGIFLGILGIKNLKKPVLAPTLICGPRADRGDDFSLRSPHVPGLVKYRNISQEPVSTYV